MSNAYKVFGFIAPSSSKFGFSTPVFENDGSLYVQIIEKDTIIDFDKVQLDRLDSYEGGVEEYFTVGDSAIYCARFDRRSYIFGDRTYLSRFLRQSASEYIDHPYFFKAADDFCTLSEPEYLGDLKDRDYLLRQSLANVMRHYAKECNARSKENQTRLALYDSKKSYKNLFEICYHEKNNSFDLLVKDILNFAYKKHKNICAYASVNELMSTSIDEHIFPKNMVKNNLDYPEVRNWLSLAIDIKKNTDHQKITSNYRKRFGNYLQLPEESMKDDELSRWESSVKASSLSLSSLSLATFISTALANKLIDSINED
ncbi:hypothetical protein [Shewanella sp.]|uniref:hypothetical protein n=1 Tax=Shewanella sp. TaxID=50422 RepID=UPI00356AB9D1